jgi:hypothetical protein
MYIIYYPDLNDKEEGNGPIIKFFKKLKDERPPALWVLVKTTLEKVENSSNLDDLERQGWVERMPYLKAPIYEFKIPPKKRKEGVARLYFAYKKNDPNTIIILSAEKKHGKTKADSEKIKQAEQRYNEVCI